MSPNLATKTGQLEVLATKRSNSGDNTRTQTLGSASRPRSLSLVSHLGISRARGTPCTRLEENDNDITSFWCDIYCNFSEYKELSKLSILILTLSPNTCDCERGFSTLNYVKNEYRSKLTNQNLNACMAVGL